MMNARSVLDLIRIRQWYKNLIVFAATFFGGAIFDLGIGVSLALAFLSFSLISSSLYCLNDILDLESDKKHRIKNKRALAGGNLSVRQASVVMFITGLVGVGVAFVIPSILQYIVAFFILTVTYSVYLKKIKYVDVFLVALNFLIRALAGANIAGLEPSVSFYIGIFSAGLFLVVGKRVSDLRIYGKTRAKYTNKTLRALFFASLILVIFAYSIFLGTSNAIRLEIAIFTFPFALFIAYKYYSEVRRGDIRGIEPIMFVFDKYLLAAIAILTVLLFLSIYSGRLDFF